MASSPPQNNHILPENSSRSQHSMPVSTNAEKVSTIDVRINCTLSAIAEKPEVDVGINCTQNSSMADIGEMSGERDQPQIKRLLSLIINTFYRNKEVCLCEIINNSSESLDKIPFESLIDKIKLDAQPELFIRIVPVEVNDTLSVIDRKGSADVSVIGKFGVRLYSAYLVAERVVVTTKHNDDVQYIWVSQAGGSFTVTRGINGQPLGRGTKITLFLLKDDLASARQQCSIRKFADAAPLPDPPVIVGGGDEESSDSSEFLRVRIPPDVADGPGDVEGDEEVEPQRAEISRKLLEEKVIHIYEEQAGAGLIHRSEFTLSGVGGYYTFAQKVKSSYPDQAELSVYWSMPHVLWPWWPQYQDISYRGGVGELDPLRIYWDDFAERIDHAVVHRRQNDTPVVFLRKFGDQPVMLDIPKSSITSKTKLDQIIHFYCSSYRGYEPYDGGAPPLDPWFCHIISYKDQKFQPLDWDEEYFEPWELREPDEDLIRLLNGEELGEPEDRGGEVEDGGVFEEQVIEEEVDEEEVDEEEREEWDAFTLNLKCIDILPVNNPEQEQAVNSPMAKRRRFV